jgi:hypothetical protein
MTEPGNLSRRQFVASAIAGSAAGPTLTAAPRPAPTGFGKAKSVVVLYLYGAPSQIDTLDPKPDAPAERRGEFGTISTRLPGVRVCEHLPRIAAALDRVCLVRSMTHASSNHAVSVALSGLPTSEPAVEANRADARHWPYFGSVLDYLWRAGAGESDGLPANIILPWPLNARTDPNRWSPHAAWLGPAYDPVYPRFRGEGSREVGNPTANGPTPLRSRFDPYDGVTPPSTFVFDGAELPADVPAARFAARARMLEPVVPNVDRLADRLRGQQRRAARLVADPRLAQAVDVTREPATVRDRYGLTLFGMEALAARRLVEAGARVVTALWDDYAYPNNAWDTHHNHFPRLKEGLCPTLDQALTAFLDDMDQRGQLAETLVMVISEHGRTPAIANVPGGGRDHWAGAYWGMFFGAGIRTGQMVGATDRQGAYPAVKPIDPKDILATMYHLLGVDAAATALHDRAGRPMPVLPHGSVVPDLLA